MTVVLDSSALMAVVQSEAGAAEVEPLLRGALMSAVNWSEVVERCQRKGVALASLTADVAEVGIRIVAFDTQAAESAAMLWPQTSPAGLSLGDRACLALAAAEGVAAVTADRAWDRVSAGVEVRVIR